MAERSPAPSSSPTLRNRVALPFSQPLEKEVNSPYLLRKRCRCLCQRDWIQTYPSLLGAMEANYSSSAQEFGSRSNGRCQSHGRHVESMEEPHVGNFFRILLVSYISTGAKFRMQTCFTTNTYLKAPSVDGKPRKRRKEWVDAPIQYHEAASYCPVLL